MQGMGSLRLGNRSVMYTAETLSKGKNRVMGTIQIMTGFLHIGFGIVLTTLTNLYTSVFVIGEIPFLGGVSFIISGCLSIGAEKSPTECAVKGSQTMNVISAIFALLGIVAFIVDLNLNVLYHSNLDYHGYLVLVGPSGDDSPFGSICEPEKRRDQSAHRAGSAAGEEGGAPKRGVGWDSSSWVLPREVLMGFSPHPGARRERDFHCAPHLHRPGILHRRGHCQLLVPGHPAQLQRVHADRPQCHPCGPGRAAGGAATATQLHRAGCS
ncbi:uncharacterized protein LOC127466377 isoform X2 [Manacus candei]|uniref:uncharacterized protein LOC127466377 isoform X2 n=1 Tax=Manacus candei TaxID=415023 RepID=UPI00222744FE|nr:uncharacterized protein LOC127466377 isoform X2 [Manacus candei]